MTRYRIADDGEWIRQVIYWRPTLKAWGECLVYGIAAFAAAWISPLLVLTAVADHLLSTTTAVVYAAVFGLIVGALRMSFLAGRRTLIFWKDLP